MTELLEPAIKAQDAMEHLTQIESIDHSRNPLLERKSRFQSREIGMRRGEIVLHH